MSAHVGTQSEKASPPKHLPPIEFATHTPRAFRGTHRFNTSYDGAENLNSNWLEKELQPTLSLGRSCSVYLHPQGESCPVQTVSGVRLSLSLLRTEGLTWDRMPRSRIEGLLAGFPRLADAGTQHTMIETESVRYAISLADNVALSQRDILQTFRFR